MENEIEKDLKNAKNGLKQHFIICVWLLTIIISSVGTLLLFSSSSNAQNDLYTNNGNYPVRTSYIKKFRTIVGVNMFLEEHKDYDVVGVNDNSIIVGRVDVIK